MFFSHQVPFYVVKYHLLKHFPFLHLLGKISFNLAWNHPNKSPDCRPSFQSCNSAIYSRVCLHIDIFENIAPISLVPCSNACAQLFFVQNLFDLVPLVPSYLIAYSFPSHLSFLGFLLTLWALALDSHVKAFLLLTLSACVCHFWSVVGSSLLIPPCHTPTLYFWSLM